MGLKLITAPPVEVLTLADAYAQCQVDTTGSPPTSAHDAWLNMSMPAVRAQVENELSRVLITQTWELWLHDFPRPLIDDISKSGGYFGDGYYGAAGFVRRYHKRRDWRAIVIPLPPLQSITSVKYLDETGTQQTLDPTAYVLDDSETPAEITPIPGTCWPLVKCQSGAVKIRFICGYPATASPTDYRANIPAPIKHWMLLMLATWFRNREMTVQGAAIATLPQVENMLFPYRVLDRASV
jgi:uncharacterized phiE125 gp8 family phage protein